MVLSSWVVLSKNNVFLGQEYLTYKYPSEAIYGNLILKNRISESRALFKDV